uniref:Uncharacterized protein n=1 Tax=Gasterosteus aculeatus TaxID=69293 RepID=G3PU76_GASAC
MLLLILLASCLASCAAQTLSPDVISAIGSISNSSGQPTTAPSVVPGNTVAFITAAVQSSHELNEETIVAFLDQAKRVIQQILPQSEVMLTLKSIKLQQTLQKIYISK